MKFVFFLILISVFAFAEDPSQICDSSQCSEPMREISSGYKNGNTNFLNKPLSAYSGSCFHQDPNYNPEKAHFGVMAFKPADATFEMTGFFGFFFEEDPYVNFNSNEVLSDLLKRGYNPISGVITKDAAEIELLTSSTEIKYWIRSDEKSERVFLIGRWSGAGVRSWQSAMFCELKYRN